MAMGRGSATQAMALGVGLVCLLVLHSKVAEAATYTVGDSAGWTINAGGWTNGKRFSAGDVLVFNYPSSAHNVVQVSAAGYKSCRTPRGARVYTSGSDRVTLSRGGNYFICNYAGHCESGMKIAVTAV